VLQKTGLLGHGLVVVEVLDDGSEGDEPRPIVVGFAAELRDAALNVFTSLPVEKRVGNSSTKV
jgi:hypothetical protein